MRYGVGSKQANDSLRALDLQLDLLRRLASEHDDLFFVQSLHGIDNISQRRLIPLNPLKPMNSTFNVDYSIVSEPTCQKNKFRTHAKAAEYLSQIIDGENNCAEMSTDERRSSAYCNKFTYWLKGSTIVLAAFPHRFPPTTLS